MKLKKLLLFLLIGSMLLLTGCWDYQDFDNLALVSALGFDLDEATNEIIVTVLYYIPGSTGGSQEKKSGAKDLPNSGVVTAKGYTIADGLQKIQEARRKSLFYGYTEVEVLGEAFAKKYLKQVLQYADRTPNIRNSIYLAFTQGNAADVLSTIDPNVSVSTGRSIRGLIDESKIAGSSFPVSIEDFNEKLAITGIEPVAPQVSYKRTADSKSSGTSESSDASKSGQDEGPYKVSVLEKGYHMINGTAAFRGDQLVGWLNVKESTGLGYILNKGMTPYENVKLTPNSDVVNTLIFYIWKSNSKIKVDMIDDKPVFTIETSVEADLRKYAENMSYQFLTPEAVADMENRLAANVASELNAVIVKSQKQLKSDILGLGFALYRKDPSLWHSSFEKDWQQLYPNVKVDINVKAKLTGTGTNIKKVVPK